MRRAKQPTEEAFLKDVAGHEMTVVLDNGIHRHLHFRNPKSGNAWFDIVTWPGYLAFSGDMGSFVFSRLKDMFEFFRNDPDRKDLYINLGYWSEKLEAVDRNGRNGGYSVFSEDRLREHVEETIGSWIEDFEGPYDSDDEEVAAAKKSFEEQLRQAIKDDVYPYFDDGPHEAFKAINDFSFVYKEKPSHKGDKYEFSDTWEWDCDEYTFRFVWCCYSLVWAIKAYDTKKSSESQGEQSSNG